MLSQTAVYSLRAMTCLALQEPGAGVRAKDLAELTGVPTPYLSKILRRLVIEGLLDSRKGHGGGFVLARPAEQITFADILHAADAVPEKGQCAFGWGLCDESEPCPLHASWSRLQDAFHGWTTSTTLAEAAASGVDPAKIRGG